MQGTTTLGTLTYTYDLAGNRIKTGGKFARSNIPLALTTTNYNANNQHLTVGTTTEAFDLNGNLATSTEAGVTTRVRKGDRLLFRWRVPGAAACPECGFQAEPVDKKRGQAQATLSV